MKLIAAIDRNPGKLFEASRIEISWLCGFVALCESESGMRDLSTSPGGEETIRLGLLR